MNILPVGKSCSQGIGKRYYTSDRSEWRSLKRAKFFAGTLKDKEIIKSFDDAGLRRAVRIQLSDGKPA